MIVKAIVTFSKVTLSSWENDVINHLVVGFGIHPDCD